MRRETRHKVIGVLVSILLFIGFSEIGLAILDPLGLNRYFGDLGKFYSFLVNDNGLYVLPDGRYLFSNWSATINQGARYTETQNRECTLGFMGDSVTFGLGVSDNQTWVNLIALRYPDIQILNYALPGYNSSDVLESITRRSLDGYIYLIIGNDTEARLSIHEPPKYWSSSLSRNLFFYWFPQQHSKE
jgi:hypothetical protein